ncbi:leucine--tRNA ligase [endosymbiont of Euscepes postfasciatus]|uniref:leucine--tRNA ligase n=1 Tax=endosymbiont of Euscepes postfasciatus TaxID=650377 RepID=UPI000DC6D570|nr:leucine--tRNA ligase [endosymbiont of Euscepes postfasciatus]BBA84599.1 leucine--tRNA ligase [endosymbiont of Euscepes postfasciatus]
MKLYNHKIIEKFVQNFWKKFNTFKVSNDKTLKKYYCLSMFPYPSGKLHIGHIRSYTIGDIFARFNRMNGKNVLFPIGWDSFGLPAENAAIENNLSPKKWTFNNINYMRKQLKLLGFSFDWDKEIITCNENYYKWEQFLFKKLYKKKIIYKKYSSVNWCNKDKTVLANEQVINNKCWRCNNYVSIKFIKQWFIKITNYSDELLNNINKLKFWPKEVKNMQKKWIGKNKWIVIKFNLINLNNKEIIINFKNIYDFLNIKFIFISLKNKLSKYILSFIMNKKNIKLYNNNVIEHIKKYGYIKTNILAINNLINRFININIIDSNYMIYIYKNKIYNNKLIDINLKNYLFFLNKKKYKNEKILYEDILYNTYSISNNIMRDDNILKINFNFKKTYTYNLKDWCISRQRNWGVPIPMATKNDKIVEIPDIYLPIKVKNYYSNDKEKIYINNNIFYLENDTLDTFIQSSWYYIRFTCNKSKYLVNKENVDYWLPIDQYIGGIEHATSHLLYFRFYNKLLRDLNFIKYDEPAIKLLCQGMVLSESYYYINKKNNIIWVPFYEIKKKIENNNIKYFDKNNNEIFYNGLCKMSKSKNNGINPSEIIEKYGADTLRVFIISLAPVNKNIIWKENNIIGIYKFLNKLWSLVLIHLNNKKINLNKKKNYLYLNKEFFNKIKNITFDIEKKQTLNTSISNIIKLTNIIYNIIINDKYNYNYDIINNFIKTLIKLLYPFAPHISFILWNKLGMSNIDFEKWPDYNNYSYIEKENTYLIYINNKYKFKIHFKKYINNKKIIKIINKLNNFKLFIKDKKIKNTYINNEKKIINFLLF